MTDNVHQLIRMHLKEHPKKYLTAVDGTLGNGFDLEFLLAQKEIITVYGFDIQEQAILTCREKIKDSTQKIHLIHDSHQYIDNYVSEKIDLAMFNLGYLPGGDKAIVTRRETTMIALEKTIQKLDDYGLMVVMTYPGHQEGEKEHCCISNYLKGLLTSELAILQLGVQNVKKPCPNIFLIIKK